MSLLDASLFFGATMLVGGIAGIWLGGLLADKLGTNNRGAYATVPGVAFLITVPLYALAILSSNLTLTFFALLLPIALSLAWLGPVISAMQHIVKPHMRATTSAIFLFINNLIGLGVGTLLIGYISDTLQARFGDDSLRYAILSGSSFYLLAAALMFVSAKRLARDWES